MTADTKHGKTLSAKNNSVWKHDNDLQTLRIIVSKKHRTTTTTTKKCQQTSLLPPYLPHKANIMKELQMLKL